MRTLEYLTIDEFGTEIYWACFNCSGAIMFQDGKEWFKVPKTFVQRLLDLNRVILTCCPECQNIALRASRVHFPKKDSNYG